MVEWDAERNARSPKTLLPGSRYHAHWRCSRCNHRWIQTVARRSTGVGCPACARRVATSANCLAVTHREIARDWDDDLNDVDVNSVLAGSRRIAWWRCAHCEHRWRATVQNRAIGRQGCPACAGQVATATNNLAITHPELLVEWLAANDRDPADVMAGSHYRAQWSCADCGHVWRAEVNKRTSGQGCPACKVRGWNVARLRRWLRSRDELLTAALDQRRAQAAAVGLLRGWGVARTIVEDALLADDFPASELRAFASGAASAVDALIDAHGPRRFAGRAALPAALRRFITERDRCCRACGSEGNLHIDHVIPLAAGGTDDAANLQVLCATCNCVKGGRALTLRQLRGLRGVVADIAVDAA